ncbi:ANTAR domain-containing response regulator [Thermincola potens]|uniref:Stage 0 sporulation protein A homolog n=1 Tax=Thermincola potens (strain JR) TaxID=635013 RepID=D5XBY4_THEPJ|nr:ANTAR domain-containing protein [Thermincola potens]ADG81532.1 response regulator receiver and ANTAR domain protein [Thermincola potens JR]
MRVLIADKDVSFIKTIKQYLVPAGYEVIAETADGITALKLTRTMQPDLVILEAFLSGMDGIEVGKIIDEGRLAGVIVVATYSELDVVMAKGDWPFPVLPKPIEPAALISVADYVVNSYRKLISLEQEVRSLQNALAARKLVERAKGILMKTQGLSEEMAFRKMQQLSMKKRLSMKKIAEAIILAHESTKA